jgi:hypothetical protein
VRIHPHGYDWSDRYPSIVRAAANLRCQSAITPETSSKQFYSQGVPLSSVVFKGEEPDEGGVVKRQTCEVHL